MFEVLLVIVDPECFLVSITAVIALHFDILIGSDNREVLGWGSDELDISALDVAILNFWHVCSSEHWMVHILFHLKVLLRRHVSQYRELRLSYLAHQVVFDVVGGKILIQLLPMLFRGLALTINPDLLELQLL